MATSRTNRENESEFRTYESQKAASISGVTQHWVSGNPYDEFLKADAQPGRVTHVNKQMMDPRTPSLAVIDQGDGFSQFSTAQMLAEIASERPKKPDKNYEGLLELLGRIGEKLLPQFQSLTFDQARAAVKHIKKKYDDMQFMIVARDPTGIHPPISAREDHFFASDRPVPMQRGWRYSLLVTDNREETFIGMQDWFTTAEGNWPPRPDVIPPMRVQPPPIQQNPPKKTDSVRTEPALQKGTGSKPLKFGPEPKARRVKAPPDQLPGPKRPTTGSATQAKPHVDGGTKRGGDFSSALIIGAVVVLPTLAFFLSA